MGMEKKLLKGITLIVFVSLISVFVAYKSGYVGQKEPPFFLSPNGSTITNTKADSDSLSINYSISEERLLMPSSKVLILSEHKEIVDTTKTKLDTINSERTKTIMGSSKSGIIFELEPELKKDTIEMKE